jgi:hypothetical protein
LGPHAKLASPARYGGDCEQKNTQIRVWDRTGNNRVVDTENPVQIENAGFRSVREIHHRFHDESIFHRSSGFGRLYISDPCRSAG